MVVAEEERDKDFQSVTREMSRRSWFTKESCNMTPRIFSSVLSPLCGFVGPEVTRPITAGTNERLYILFFLSGTSCLIGVLWGQGQLSFVALENRGPLVLFFVFFNLELYVAIAAVKISSGKFQKRS